jgi:hypothetical protein
LIEALERRPDPLDRRAVLTHRLVNLRQIELGLSNLRVLLPQHVADDHQRLLVALCGCGEAFCGLQDMGQCPVPSGHVEMPFTQGGGGQSERTPGQLLRLVRLTLDQAKRYQRCEGSRVVGVLCAEHIASGRDQPLQQGDGLIGKAERHQQAAQLVAGLEGAGVVIALLLTIDRQGLTSAADDGIHVVEPAQYPGFFEQQIGHLHERRSRPFQQGACLRQARPGLAALAKIVLQVGQRLQAAGVGDGVGCDGGLVDLARLIQESQCLLVATELGVEAAKLDQSAGILRVIFPRDEGMTGEGLQVERFGRAEASQVAVQVGHDECGAGECRVVGPFREDRQQARRIEQMERLGEVPRFK